jgi:hypothetical protein
MLSIACTQRLNSMLIGTIATDVEDIPYHSGPSDAGHLKAPLYYSTTWINGINITLGGIDVGRIENKRWWDSCMVYLHDRFLSLLTY